ncbi:MULTISPECIES: Ig-like domain-containing protein [unclassified Pseudomonas]|nr:MULTISPECIES: Ig-like domain-containing protein [unclassified Pseudomonas]MCU1739381.1 Ig-like domain-containing protein [Pseudomonas sp. 20S_6.2_Bac1]
MIIPLEPRMLFDGAVAATVVDAAQPANHTTADAAKAPATDSTAASSDAHPQSDATPTPAPAAVPGQSVVFVDSRVQDFSALLKGVAPGTQVVVLQAGKDGLQQIADYLDTHQGVSTVEIIAHGNSGDLWLGSTYLSSTNVAARADVLARIGNDMNVGGDILIYACNTAEGATGIGFVDSLAQYTGRDIAASDNRTGLGGDWTLEISTGVIESHNVLSADAMAAYQYALSTITVTSNADSGVGSLRSALSSAVAGDIITFNASMTVNLNSQLVISKNLTIEGDLDHNGTPDVTLSGQYKTQVLMVNSGITATLDGLVITQGLAVGNGAAAGVDGTAAMGGGIVNAGNLTLNNVTVTSNAASGGGGGGGVTAPYVGGAVGGGGGGGGALGGQNGGHGGSSGYGTGVYGGTSGTANHGGTGGGYNPSYMGGKGGSSTGGAGGIGAANYSNGGAGGTANNGTISIGGGGGGSGWDKAGRAGASASGGIYNASTGTLTIVGTSVISSNIAAGGGGGGGGGLGGSADSGGAAGKGVGAIWNKGTLLMTAANFAAMTGNVGGSGSGGPALGGGGTGASVAAVNNIFNDGGTLNTAYAPAPTATIVVGTTAQHIGSTSLVTITFNQAVTGFTNADLTIANGTLGTLTTSDNITYTATFTPNSSVTSATNHIVLDNTGVTSTSTGTPGTGTTSSNNYAIDTVRPTATVSVVAPTLSTTVNSTVNITFSEAVSSFSLADMSASNGTLSNLTTSDNIHWTATLTPSASNNSSGNVITLDNTLYTDTATNAGTGTTTSNTYVVDTVRPTATIVVSDTALNVNGNSSLVTITFSETVNNLALGALTVADGSLSNLVQVDGTHWTATLTANPGVNHVGDVITLNTTAISDVAGNAGSGTTTSNAYAVDTVLPTATIVFGNTNLGIGQTSPVTITFNEAVPGFTNADLTVSNGTLSTVSTSDGGVTWIATFTPTAAIVSASNHITLDTSHVSDAAGNVGSGTVTSNNVAIDGVRPTATIVVSNNNLGIGGTSTVTITFSEAVSGMALADLTTDNGTLSGLSTSDNITYTALLTPTPGITQNNNHIVLDNSTVIDGAGNSGTGTTSSNAYALDSTRPTATIVVANPTLAAGQSSLVTITFSEAVNGFDNNDLSVPNGTLTAVSTSDAGVTWTATFTPTDGVHDTTNLISLNNSGVQDGAGNAGTGITNSGNFTIDTVRPTATIVVADNALKIGETSLVTITFSEAVTGFSNADLTIIDGGTLSAVQSSDGGITWTATFTPTSNITHSSNVIELNNTLVANASGNTGSGVTDSNNYSIDTQRPTASIVVANPALNIGGISLVTITFSEAVTGFSNADLTVADGTLSNVSSSDGGITWTATLTPNAATTHTGDVISLNNTLVSDLAGNAGAGTTLSNTYGIDTVAPTATIVVSNTALNVNGSTSLVTITFSETVNNLTAGALTVADGSLSNLVQVDGTHWTATLTANPGVTHTGDVITLNNTLFSDSASNAGSGTTTSNTYAIDTQRPTATIVVANSALSIGQTSLVTITFSEAVSGLTTAAFSVADGTLSGLSSGDGGITWTATLTATAGVTHTGDIITLNNAAVSDGAGNAGSGSTDSNTYSVDTQRPTASIVVNNSLKIGGTSLVTITFSEAVTGFSNADLTVADGTLSAVSSSDGGITWTAILTPNAATTHTGDVISLNNTLVSDLAGNAGAGTTLSNTYGVDTVAPTASVVIDHSALNIGQTAGVTITFSEAVTGFSNADLTVANGTLSTMSSSDGGITWTGTFTPTSNIAHASNVISLNNTTYNDLAGNAGTGTTDSNNYAIDTQRPTASIVVANSALNIGQTSLVTITFSEAVSGLTTAAFTVADGALSGLSSSDGGITWTATLTATAGVTHTGDIITLNNTAVSDVAGNAGSGTTDSNTYSVDTQRPTATISVANNNLGIGQTTTVTIAFSEVVTGFNLSELSVPNGTLSNLASADGGKTWTATLTPTAAVTDATNLIVLDTSLVSDTAGNTGASIAISNNYALDANRPTATISVANPNLTTGQTTVVTFTFSEKVSNFDLSELSVANGTLSNLTSADGGKTWTATLTPSANVTDPSNFITLDNSLVTDLAGNAGTGFANSNNFAVNTVALGGDPQFRVESPVARPDAPNLPLQPQISVAPTGDLGSPLGFPPLFEQRTSGDGIPPLGNIFINQNALAPSYIAQVFSTDSGATGSTSGFLGFGGGDGGVFGSSTVSGIFNRDSGNSDTSTSQVFDRNGKGLGDPAQGVRGIFGAPTLGQQLQKIKDGEQKQLHELAWALEQVGISEMSA